MSRSMNTAAIFVLAALAGCGGSQTVRPAEPTTSQGGVSTTATTAGPDDAASAAPDDATATAMTTTTADASATPAADAGATQAVADAAPAFDLPAMPADLQGPARPWAQMNARQRSEYMDDHIMPVMRQMLRAYDGRRYATVNCATCHGRNARQVNFHMPNTLPVLHAWGTPEARRQHDENPRMFAFMGERVVPVMSTLLGLPRWSRENTSGFGCSNCHGHGPAAPAAPAAPATTTGATPAASTRTTSATSATGAH